MSIKSIQGISPCESSFDMVWVPEATQKEIIFVFNQLAIEKKRPMIQFDIEVSNGITQFWGGDFPFWRGHYLSISRISERTSSESKWPDSLEAISLLAAQHVFSEKPGFGFWAEKEIICADNSIVRAKNPNVIEVRAFKGISSQVSVYPVFRNFED